MSETSHSQREHNPRRFATIGLAVALLLLVGAAAGLYSHLQHQHMRQRLLQLLPDAAGNDPALERFAVAQAKPLYQQYCVACHGADLHGNSTLGAPNLTDKVWLYGDGSVHEIERTLLYGIRSGHGKAHNVTDMPAFGSTGKLSAAEITDEVQYLMQLSGRSYQTGAANEGKALYAGKGGCGDCHGYDGHGSADYGAPDLTANVWNSGGDPQSLFKAIYFGQHHLMPGWIGILSLEQIRALAVYIHSVSQPSATAVGAY